MNQQQAEEFRKSRSVSMAEDDGRRIIALVQKLQPDSLLKAGGADLRNWIMQKLEALNSFHSEIEQLERCGINDCRTTALYLCNRRIEDELLAVGEVVAAPAAAWAAKVGVGALRKSASGFSHGDSVKVISARHRDLSGRIGTVMTSNTNETSVKFENGSMAIVKTFEVALVA